MLLVAPLPVVALTLSAYLLAQLAAARLAKGDARKGSTKYEGLHGQREVCCSELLGNGTGLR